MLEFEKGMEHIVSEVICVACRNRWIAARPTTVHLKDLECPLCGPGAVIETGARLDTGGVHE